MKVRTTLYLDQQVVKTAMEIGINISQFCEHALKQATIKLQNLENSPNCKPDFSLAQSSAFAIRKDGEKRNLKMVGLPGFEPGSIEPKSTSLDQTSRQPLDSLTELDSVSSRTMID